VRDTDNLLSELDLHSDEPARSQKNSSAYGGNDMGLDRATASEREDALAKRERQIAERERQLAAREKAISAGGANYKPADNWPCSYYPLTYHDIAAEIPEEQRMFCRQYYATVLGTWVVLVFNFISWFGIWLGESDQGSGVLWSLIYVGFGIPGSWKLWYYPIYETLKGRKRWYTFGFSFLAHVGFCGFMCLGFPDMAAAGWLQMVEVFASGHAGTGLIVLACACCWTLLLLASLYLGKKAHSMWSGAGGVATMQQDVATLAVTSGAAGAAASAAISTKETDEFL
jgi:hypothetical protein